MIVRNGIGNGNFFLCYKCASKSHLLSTRLICYESLTDAVFEDHFQCSIFSTIILESLSYKHLENWFFGINIL